jgi:hypothetical protein
MKMRKYLLRANAAYIGVAGASGLLFDIRGIFFGSGPQSRILGAVPYAGISFVEAHGLAVILSALLWRSAPERSWHFTALAMEVLLGTANLVFWQVFVAGDALAVGYVTTALHWIFAGLQLMAALSVEKAGEVSAIHAGISARAIE